MRSVVEDMPGGKLATGVYDGVNSGKSPMEAITDEYVNLCFTTDSMCNVITYRKQRQEKLTKNSGR